ncbi:hypothetical protein Sme01_17980 [Sphaerisporangium melleum]|uniref:Uncharacterized protein n=1 Tax=Sphaerisporangium melleum TaxID=321316 RepID=A0A917R2Q6_9ACTN|nr:hypothetical protein [Sphaerisporangium melleum]GGK83862.1 hypothetical protein GCM10007964_27920 [Sphaerisporangium melleum]GII69322.1 hypothetical protein Sme01_17980 [Sphaerisporangium melleum]
MTRAKSKRTTSAKSKGRKPAQAPPASPAQEEAPAGTDPAEDAEPRNPVVRTLSRSAGWLVTTIAGGLATIIGGVLLAGWPQVQDAWADHWETPRLEHTIYNPISTGDRFAFHQVLTGGPGRLLNGADPDPAKLEAFVAREHGAVIGSMNVSLVVQGRRHRPLRILDVRPRVRRSMDRPSGTCFVVPSSGGTDKFKIEVDLDEVYRGKGPSRYLEKNIDLAYDEMATVDLTVTAEERAYDWDIQVDYVYDGAATVQHAYFTAEDGGLFRVTGQAPAYRVAYTSRTLAAVFRRAERNASC